MGYPLWDGPIFIAQMGLERAAPVRTLVLKHAGGMFLARGRALQIHETSEMDVDQIQI